MQTTKNSVRKAKWLAIAAGTGMACTAQVHADATLWGHIGGDVMVIDNIKTATGSGTRVSEGSDYGVSVWGINASEDLGSGNKALVALEGRFDPSNGNMNGGPGKIFARAAWLGLQNDNYGVVRFGQQKIVNNFTYRFDPLLAQNFSGGTFVNSRNNSKFPNSIRYDSPSYAGGLEFSSSLSLGEGLNGFRSGSAGATNGMVWGVSTGYVRPTWEVRAVYDQVNNPNGQKDNLFVASSGLFLGAMARFGPALVQATYSRYWAPDTAPGLSKTADFYWTGVTYDITPRLHTTGAVYYINIGPGKWTADHDGAGHATMLGLGGTYDLSKRTFLYATYAHVFNSAQANFSVFPTNTGLTGGTGFSPAQGQGQNGFYAGMMHSF